MPQKYIFFDSVLDFEKFLFNKFLIVEKRGLDKQQGYMYITSSLHRFHRLIVIGNTIRILCTFAPDFQNEKIAENSCAADSYLDVRCRWAGAEQPRQHPCAAAAGGQHQRRCAAKGLFRTGCGAADFCPANQAAADFATT